jgi:hypothetical protein
MLFTNPQAELTRPLPLPLVPMPPLPGIPLTTLREASVLMQRYLNGTLKAYLWETQLLPYCSQITSVVLQQQQQQHQQQHPPALGSPQQAADGTVTGKRSHAVTVEGADWLEVVFGEACTLKPGERLVARPALPQLSLAEAEAGKHSGGAGAVGAVGAVGAAAVAGGDGGGVADADDGSGDRLLLLHEEEKEKKQMVAWVLGTDGQAEEGRQQRSPTASSSAKAAGGVVSSKLRFDTSHWPGLVKYSMENACAR